MFCLSNYITLLIIVLWSIVNGHFPSPFDVRIDHHKVDITHDLIINTPRPQFSWKIRVLDNVKHRNVQQIAYQIQLQSTKLSKHEKLFQWDSERVISSQSIHVQYSGYEDLLSSTYYRFRVRVWTTNSKEPSEWTRWIQFRTPLFNLNQHLTSNSDLIWIGSNQINMNELRKEFYVPNTSPIKSAIVYICGLGYYELYLNGNKVDPTRKLDPGWTTFEKRTLVVSYDVTPNITVGINAVGVKLGNGWYSQAQQHEKYIYGPPRLMFNLTITFNNGEQTQVLSDLTWTGREGSIKYDSVYKGEIYDSQRDRPNWTQAGFNDTRSAWIMPDSLKSPVNETPMGLLVLQDMPPIRSGPEALHFEVTTKDDSLKGYLNHEDIGEIKGASLTDGGIIKPVATWLSDSTLRTFDLGQNMAGWCRVRFQGPRGFGTQIRHAEVLTQPVASTNYATRNIFVENLRNATASDIYILRGDPAGEIYEPTFTVHGFRYMSIFGPPGFLTSDDVECPVVHSETTLKGNFTTSNPIINQIQHNIQWTQLSNLMSLPTDCPQRDERRGWMGDAGLSVDEALYNFDLIKFYQNFLNLILDMQKDNGQIPDIVPGGIYPADPNWGTALPTIAWQLYRHYGDPKILEPYYDSVRAYVESVRSIYNGTGLANFFCRYGDWLPPPPYPQTNRSLTSSFAFLHDVSVITNMSQVLGKTNDTNIYSALYQQLADEFHRVFFNTASNFYADGMQTAQVLALALPDVVPPNLRSAVVDYLVSNISKEGNHATAGIVGVAQLYPVLSDNGHHDLALEMISVITYPSFGYMFNNPYENATTLWEELNEPDSRMGSRNHIMYGAVGAWFYSHLAGIDLSTDLIILRPRMASESKKHLMKKLDCQLSTLYGLVHISYTRDERDTIANSILLRVSIPPNAQSRVMFEPLFAGGQCETLTEGGKVIWSSDDVTANNDQEFDIEKDSVTGIMSVHIGSGQYEFEALWR